MSRTRQRITELTMIEIEHLIGKKKLLEIVPFSAQHILRLEKQGKFPRRIKLGERRVGWRASEIEAWIGARAAASR